MVQSLQFKQPKPDTTPVILTGKWDRTLDPNQPDFENARQEYLTAITQYFVEELASLYLLFIEDEATRQTQELKLRMLRLKELDPNYTDLVQDHIQFIEELNLKPKSYPILILGLPGSGKSTLADVLQATFVSPDDPSKELLFFPGERVPAAMTGLTDYIEIIQGQEYDTVTLPDGQKIYSRVRQEGLVKESAEVLIRLIAYTHLNLGREMLYSATLLRTLLESHVPLLQVGGIIQILCFSLASAGFKKIPEELMRLIQLLPFKPLSILETATTRAEHEKMLKLEDPKRTEALKTEGNLAALYEDLKQNWLGRHVQLNPNDTDLLLKTVTQTLIEFGHEGESRVGSRIAWMMLMKYSLQLELTGECEAEVSRILLMPVLKNFASLRGYIVELQLHNHPELKKSIKLTINFLIKKYLEDTFIRYSTKFKQLPSELRAQVETARAEVIFATHKEEPNYNALIGKARRLHGHITKNIKEQTISDTVFVTLIEPIISAFSPQAVTDPIQNADRCKSWEQLILSLETSRNMQSCLELELLLDSLSELERNTLQNFRNNLNYLQDRERMLARYLPNIDFNLVLNASKES
ncbi:MAG: hypothetical protein JNK26_04720 [Candidatus Doudnabacteria bacterium]|nr:hypothetical protein [Candidatus Doudnabacteria bacterium]